MKFSKTIFVVALTLTLQYCAWGQGITFSTKSFDEVLAQAKAENRPVFVDVFTKSCSPCRKMDKEVFNDPILGKFFNDSLISFKLDAGDAKFSKLLDQYNVYVFPTFFYFAPTGKLAYKSNGYMNSTDLLTDAGIALKQTRSKKPLAIWDEEYLTQKNDTTFLLKYIKKRIYAGVTITPYIEEYLNHIKPEDRYNTKLVTFLSDNAYSLPIDGLCYDLALNSCKKNNEHKTEYASQELMDYFLANYSMGILKIAIDSKSEPILQKAISVASCIHDPILHAPGFELEFKKGYFYEIGDYSKYMTITEEFINCYILPKNNKLIRDTLSTIISLNKGATGFCEHTSSRAKLGKALEWSDLSIELSSTSPMLKTELYWQCLDTKANLLIKTHQTDEALILKQQALDAIPLNEFTIEIRNKIKGELEKMKSESTVLQ